MATKKSNALQPFQSLGDRALVACIYCALSLGLFVVLYPLVFVISASFSSPSAMISGRVWLYPVEFSLAAYKTVLENQQVRVGFTNSLIYTMLGTTVNVTLTMLAAYPLSRRDLVGRGFFMFLFTFTMLFSGGLIPTYLQVKNFHMIDTLWALIIPSALSVWLVIIARTYFQTNIPIDMYEAAVLDGCDHFNFFARVALPLAIPIIAVLTLMYAVGHWNSFFSALIYINSERLYPLQLVLRNILIQNVVDPMMMTAGNVKDDVLRKYLVEVLKYALIVVATVPILLLYPFIQKYFIRGIMVGSLKG